MDKLYKYPCMDGNIYICRPDSCLICKNNDSILWDYTNGPYFVSCALHMEPIHDPIEKRLKCRYFKLDEDFEEVKP